MCQWRTCCTARTCRNPDTCPTDSGRSSSAPPPMKPYPIRNPCTSRPCLHGTSLRGSPHTTMTQPWRSDRSRISCTTVRYTAYCKHLRGKANRSCHHTSREQSTGQARMLQLARQLVQPLVQLLGTSSVLQSEPTRTPSPLIHLSSIAPPCMHRSDRTHQHLGTCRTGNARSSFSPRQSRQHLTHKPCMSHPYSCGTSQRDSPCMTMTLLTQTGRSRMPCTKPHYSPR
jgi:hypothetical protein